MFLAATPRNSCRHGSGTSTADRRTWIECFAPQALAEVFQLVTPEEHINWYWSHLIPTRKKAARYPVSIALKHGPAALVERPKIVIGTGHSVKGGEADVVYILPDLSPAGHRNWLGRRSDKDAVIRLGYVMMTRAKQELVICNPAGPGYLPIAETARRARRAS